MSSSPSSRQRRLVGALIGSLLLWPPAGAAGQVALNHLYVYLDTDSYDAATTSPFIRERFAATRQGTVADTRGSWSGFYLFGRQTYLELYRAGPNTLGPGTVGLAFGVDHSGALDRVASRLRAAGHESDRVARMRPIGSDTVRWFDQLSPAPPDSAAIGPTFRWWVMEYDSGYLARRPPSDSALRGRIDRASYNGPLFRSDLAVRDIVGLVLRVPRQVLPVLAGQLEAIGLDHQERAESVRFVADSVTIDLEPASTGAGGLSEVRFRTDPMEPAASHQLGRATLEIGGGSASFGLRRLTDLPRPGGCRAARLEVATIASRVFSNTRSVRVLLPPSYDDPGQAGTRFPVIYFTDGIAAMDSGGWGVPAVADSLWCQGKLPEAIVVAIDNGGSTREATRPVLDRAEEFLPFPDQTWTAPPLPVARGAGFPAFLFDEVMPLIASRYRVRSEATDVTLAGSSYGAAIMLYAALIRPGRVGALLLESPSLHIGDDSLLAMAAAADQLPARVYLGVGTAEGDDREAQEGMVERVERLAVMLRRREPAVAIRVEKVVGGIHWFSAWRERLPVALQFTLPKVE